MPWRIFRREKNSSAQSERREQVEKALADGLRTVADLLRKSADLIEARRLERSGYEKQEKFLERVSPSQQDRQ